MTNSGNKRHQRRNRPIRVTYLITDLKVGGAPLHLHRLLTRLPRERIEPRVICLADEGPVGGMLRQAGIQVFTCRARSAWDVRALGRLYKLLSAEPPDILHTFLFHANMAGRIVGWLAGLSSKQILCEIHTVELERSWHLLLDNLTCRMCRNEIGISPSVVKHLHDHAHIPMSRLRCELGAVDVEAIASAKPISRSSLGLPTDEPLVIWVGRLDPVKGFEEMLAAFARVCKDQPAKLVLVGDGPYRPTVERLIRQNNLSDQVSLLGERLDVPSLLKTADLFLFCSRTEGLPTVLLEAMAAGLPILATDIPGCRDLIDTGKTGILVPAGDIEAIATGLKRLLIKPDEGREIGRRANYWALEKVGIYPMVERWLTCYEAI